MSKDSKIEWTSHTFNPWRGCTKVSPGCAHCYADKMSGRNPKVLGVWGANGTRVVAADAYWKQPIKWAEAARASGERHRVFCASLADVFEHENTMPPSAWADVAAARARLFDLIYLTPSLDWLLLTKRPENVMNVVFQAWDSGKAVLGGRPMLNEWWRHKNPPHNVWLGTSVEDQASADKRIPEILKVPAAVRFLSCEPLLGPSDLKLRGDVCRDWDGISFEATANRMLGYDARGKAIHWVIVGGESGPGARPMHPDWARSIRDQCESAGVAFFFKQWGEYVPWDRSNTTIVQANELVGRPDFKLHRRMMPDGSFPAGPCTREQMDDYQSRGVYVVRVGKKAAGRLLDGREWSEFPRTAEPARA